MKRQRRLVFRFSCFCRHLKMPNQKEEDLVSTNSKSQVVLFCPIFSNKLKTEKSLTHRFQCHWLQATWKLYSYFTIHTGTVVLWNFKRFEQWDCFLILNVQWLVSFRVIRFRFLTPFRYSLKTLRFLTL